MSCSSADRRSAAGFGTSRNDFRSPITVAFLEIPPHEFGPFHYLCPRIEPPADDELAAHEKPGFDTPTAVIEEFAPHVRVIRLTNELIRWQGCDDLDLRPVGRERGAAADVRRAGQLQLSQPAFARLLGVAAETYRTWDSGRREVPDTWLDKARTIAAAKDPHRLRSLQDLALELGVHVRTLRDAARAGRLKVTYGNRVVFGIPIPRATMTAGRDFLERYYRQSYSRFAPKHRRAACRHVPADWAARLLRLRRELGLSQQRLAERIGAAGKAVVYQWESGRRKPSPILWEKIQRLRPDL